MLDYILRQLHRSHAIQFNHPEFLLEIGLPELPTHADPRIDAGNIQRTPNVLHRLPKLLNASARCQIRRNLGYLDPKRIEIAHRAVQPLSSRADHKVIPARPQFSCQPISNSPRRTCYKCKHVRHISQPRILVCVLHPTTWMRTSDAGWITYIRLI